MKHSQSRFAGTCGVLFAADLPNDLERSKCLDAICEDILAVKIGNSVLYRSGVQVISEIKMRYGLPIVADLKLTDVAHIAGNIVHSFADAGADAIVISGICGYETMCSATLSAGACEIWAFTEFTSDDGLISAQLADMSVRVAMSAGVVGFQVPGTRPYRIEDVRSDVGDDVVLISCGIGVQGARFGSAVLAGANMEIVGRSIYASHSPREAARQAKMNVQNARCMAKSRESKF